MVGGVLAGTISNRPLLSSLLADKNLRPKEKLWLGTALLADGSSSVWSRQLSGGDFVSFLTYSLIGDDDEQNVREADPEMNFPFICKGRVHVQVQNLGFEIKKS